MFSKAVIESVKKCMNYEKGKRSKGYYKNLYKGESGSKCIVSDSIFEIIVERTLILWDLMLKKKKTVQGLL